MDWFGFGYYIVFVVEMDCFLKMDKCGVGVVFLCNYGFVIFYFDNDIILYNCNGICVLNCGEFVGYYNCSMFYYYIVECCLYDLFWVCI